MNPIMLMLAAGAALGYLDRSSFSQSLPKLPFIGEHGTVAAAAYALRSSFPLATPIMQGALFLSAYELVKQGSITGPAWDV